MDIRTKVICRFPRRLAEAAGIDECTLFRAYYEEGQIVIETADADEADSIYEEGFSDGYDEGYEDGLDDAYCRDADECPEGEGDDK